MALPMISFAAKEPELKQLTIISAYNEAAPWARQYISAITREISNRTDFKTVDLTFLNNILVYNEEDYLTIENGVMDKFKDNHPDYVVLLGNFAFCLRDRIKKEWGDVPILLIAQSDKYGPREVYFTDSIVSDEKIPPVLKPIDQIRNDYNFTLVQSPNKPRETVDMMIKMFPDMNKIVFMGDALFGNRYVSHQLREYIKLKYPDVKYEWLKASENTTMHAYLNNPDPNVGLLLSTWYYVSTNVNGFPMMNAGDSHLIQGANRPVFGLRYAYFSYGILGCYAAPHEETEAAIINALDAMLAGKDMRSVPFSIPQNAVPMINYSKMVSLGILEAQCPENTVFLDKPKTAWETYSIYVYLGISVFLLVIIFLVSYIVLMKRRAKLKRAYNNLVESMPIGYQKVKISLDCHGKMIGVKFSNRNRALSQMVEHHNLKEMDRLKSDSYWQEIADAMVASSDTKKSIFKTSADNAFIEFIMYPSDETSEDMVVVDVFALDVTDKIKMEQVLREAAQKALEADNMKSAFLANMSHEIRTPINAIVGFAGLLCKTQDPEKKKKFIHIIESNNRLLQKLIEDVLDISRAESDKLVLNISSVDINKLIHTLVGGLDMTARKDVRVLVDLELKKCVVTTDAFRLSQVLSNLLSNSLKFTERGTITVGYKVEGDMLKFYVKDTGRGMSTSELKVVFDRAARLDAFIQGTGLGLTISKAVVEKLGGNMEAQSEGRGKGTTFFFTIPYVLDESKNTYSEEEYEELHFSSSCKKNESASSVETDSFKENQKLSLPSYKHERRKVLIVEDNESNYQLYEALFDGRYDLVHAWDGEEAIRLFAKETPDIVLMDIGIPFKNGYEATAEIRMLSKTEPIIAVTSYSEPSDQQKMLQRGFNDYLTKPIDENILLKTLRKYL